MKATMDVTDRQFDIEASIKRGDLAEAREATLSLFAETSDPGTGILATILETQLEAFEQAATLLRKIATDHPSWRTLCEELALCVEADHERTLRRTDPDAAQQRAGIGPPPPYAMAQLEALVYHARGAFEDARRMLDEARSMEPALGGRLVTIGGEVHQFTAVRDSDDLTGPLLVGIGPRGILDLPYSELSVIEFMPTQTYHDVLWPVARIETADQQTFKLRVPSLYPGSGVAEMAEIRSGALTMWDRPHEYAIASGQRDLRVETADSGFTVGLRQIARIEIGPLPH